MIQRVDIEQRQRLLQMRGQRLVRCARLGIPARVIMRHDDSGGVTVQRRLGDLSRIDRSLIERSLARRDAKLNRLISDTSPRLSYAYLRPHKFP